MDTERFEKAESVKRAFDAVEHSHPGSRPVAVLHGRLAALLNSFKSELTPDQFVALGGGVPKPDEGIEEEGEG